eukprot:COSAG01_NODE_1163_length_11454_cov_3.546808_7_plen_67_part_00
MTRLFLSRNVESGNGAPGGPGLPQVAAGGLVVWLAVSVQERDRSGQGASRFVGAMGDRHRNISVER